MDRKIDEKKKGGKKEKKDVWKERKQTNYLGAT